MSEPIHVPSKLAPIQSTKPQLSVSVKTKSGETLQAPSPVATRTLVSLMDMNAVLGGAASHYGGPAAFAELMSALHAYVFSQSQKAKKDWFEMYNIVNDAGHCENGLYALKANYGLAGLNFDKLKKFRSIDSVLTGHGEAHLFPEGVLISNGPLGSALPQSQGLAMADAHAKKKRVTITAISDGACMEGEAREALAAIPGLAKRGQMAPFVLIISDNNTKLSGRIDQESYSMQPTFESLKALGWKVISVPEGNDLQKCLAAVETAVEEANQNPNVPVAIHAKTVKGIGTQKTAASSSGGHGFPLKSPSELPEFLSEIGHGVKLDLDYNGWVEELRQQEDEQKKAKTATAAPEEKIQTGISNAMIKLRKQGLPIVSITSDLPGSTGVAGFRKEFASDSFDVGVAESNMISVAAGFSKTGYIPVVDTFAQFGVTKGALPITMAMLSEAPVICIFSHTGFQDAADGASHQALSYLAMVSSIPHVDCYLLSCSEEAESLLSQTLQKFAEQRKAGQTPRTSIFFLGRENFPKNYNANLKYELGKGQLVYESKGDFKKFITLVAGGSMVVQALEAAKQIEKQERGVIILNPSIVNHPDLDLLKTTIAKSQGKVVMVEDHQMIGGMNQMLTFALVQAGVNLQARYLAVNGEFGQSAYNAIDLYRKHGLDSSAIVKAALSL